MPQHDYDIANQTFPNTRADINNALEAIATNNEGTTAPSTTYPYQWWYDTTNELLKIRNSDNDAWITLAFFSQTTDTWQPRAQTLRALDSNGLSIQTDEGTARLSFVDNGAVVFPSDTIVVRLFQDITDTPGLNNATTGGSIQNTGDGATQFLSRSGVVAQALNTNTDGVLVRYAKSGVQVGSVEVDATSTTYATSSDYRLKTDLQAVSNPLGRLANLKPVNFEWVSSGKRTDGFIAHEAAEVVPEAVTGVKDAVDADGNPIYQGIDQGKLVPLLTAALQEAVAKIDDLEARLEALENA